MLNLMKPSKEQSSQSEDKGYILKQVLMFAGALRLRPFIVHMGAITPLTATEGDVWFEQIVCMFHPSAAWLNRMTQSTLFNSGAQKKLQDGNHLDCAHGHLELAPADARVLAWNGGSCGRVAGPSMSHTVCV